MLVEFLSLYGWTKSKVTELLLTSTEVARLHKKNSETVLLAYESDKNTANTVCSMYGSISENFVGGTLLSTNFPRGEIAPTDKSLQSRFQPDERYNVPFGIHS